MKRIEKLAPTRVTTTIYTAVAAKAAAATAAATVVRIERTFIKVKILGSEK